ncbi:MAG TPA: diaminopimelate decarboxylase [Polyangiaceae bacterium]
MPGFARDSLGAAVFAARPVSELLAEAGVATPTYIYDLDGIRSGARELLATLPAPHAVAYAVKANSAASIVRTLASEGTGADVVSGAELELALLCGVPSDRIVMSGVGKSDHEIELAIVAGIRGIQVESVEEIARVSARARALNRRARVALRVNPNVLIDSHAHIATGHDAAKFGIPLADLDAAWQRIDAEPDTLVGVGISSHVGSNMGTTEAYAASGEVLCDVARARLAHGKTLEYVNFGGGFGIDGGTGSVAAPREFAQVARELLTRHGLEQLSLGVEPGRSMVGPYGLLVASVIQPKVGRGRRWIMIDAGMNDLIRPALYGALHRIEPLERPPSEGAWRVVGPVCESSDDFGEHPLGDRPPEQVAIRDTGAYGFVMASEYNGRGLPNEVFVEGGRVVKVSRSSGSKGWLERRLQA